MDGPGKNSLGTEMMDRLLARIAEAKGEPILLTGAGDAFSAGLNLKEVVSLEGAAMETFLRKLDTVMATLFMHPAPTVALVNGHAIAGGCIMAAACDYRVLVEGTSRMGVPELAVGVPFPTLPFEIVRARVPPAAFRDLVFSGRMVLPQEAVALGLADEIAPHDVLLARAQQAADRLAAIPAVTFALTKRTFAEPLLARIRAAAPLNDEVVAAWADEGVQQHVRAYLEKALRKA